MQVTLRRRVHAALARRDDWLLIFDNAADPVDIDGLLPPAGGGRVLITSQFSALASRSGARRPRA